MALKVTKLTLQVVIALVGVVGNLLVCIVITKRANMKTTMNLYLRNLAIADLGVLLVTFPLLAIAEHGTSGFPFGRFFCLYIYPATEIFYGASTWSITVIAIERYRNIISRRSFAKRAESSKKVTLKILLIWLISFIVVAVPMYPIIVYHEVTRACYPDWPHFADGVMIKVYVIVIAVFWYLLPLGIITCTYMKISNKLKQSTIFHKAMHGEDSAKSNLIKKEERQRLKQNKKAKRILTPLILVFVITMLPFNIFRFAAAFSYQFHYNKFYYLYASVCGLFVVINSAVDPIIYYISSKEFRKVLQPMLSLGCSQKQHSDDSQTKISPTTKTQREALSPTQELAELEM
ncbi:hypothetical protein QZH41_001275 [Actinostola sp. cb2023]|nr:hypothetical protein QZH41_001275 [Actinostola sp. cb2023]